MSAPIRYFPSFTADESLEYKNGMFRALNEHLNWIHVEPTTPREEFYWHAQGLDYTYGSGRGQRTYKSQDDHGNLGPFQNVARHLTGVTYDVCFLNRYRDSHDSLNWHSDSSPEMDDRYPIVIQSFGEERNIMFRKKLEYVGCPDCGATIGQLHNVDCELNPGSMTPARVSETVAKEWQKNTSETIRLAHGSVCIMMPGMQVTWEHRIPKHDRVGGVRISLTWRKYRNLVEVPLETK